MFILVSVLVAVLAFVLGTQVRSADATILDAREQVVPVYASVENRSVTQDIRIQGEVVIGDSYRVYAKRPEGTERMVVTKVVAKPGTEISSGMLLGTVSDRPIFCLMLEAPLFRDLHTKDSGTDVFRLQKALGVSATGVMNGQTMEVIREMYAKAGVLPPGGKGAGSFLKMDEFVSLPAEKSTSVVRTIAQIGTELSDDTPFAQLGFGASFVNVRASVSEADKIKLKEQTTVQTPGDIALTGKVVAISDFQSEGTTAGRPPGRDIRIELPKESELISGQIASVLFGAKTEPEKAVPTIAIRSDAAGDYVMRRAGNSQAERVDVTVTRNASGWTAINVKELEIGDEVLVSS
ncbi:hypothetical protein CQ018_09630 [Arthrobacter sp. MYb227]|uniref:hypothetical protein n=1 Tax=Arthrobacter sp. MYb227 TaxID=1848601 RepID=UPI000CFB38FB|nr:hypothetical protein [Arthrobacter sp. MYb227]PQZ93889.1 hypothetical protein CQ018_09630 [Arthrobacter sp. MYb227]